MKKVISISLEKEEQPFNSNDLIILKIVSSRSNSVKIYLDNTNQLYGKVIYNYFKGGFQWFLEGRCYSFALFDATYSNSLPDRAFSESIEMMAESQVLSQYPRGYKDETFASIKVVIDSLVNKFSLPTLSEVDEYYKNLPKLEKTKISVVN